MKYSIKLRATMKVDHTFPPVYENKNDGYTYILTSLYTFQRIATEKFIDPATPKPSPHQLNFTTRKLEEELSYDISDTSATYEPIGPQDVTRKDCIDIFYRNHPLTLINGKPHARTITGAQIYYDMIDVPIQIANDYNSWKDKWEIAQYLSDLEYPEIRDVAYYFGVKPTEKTGTPKTKNQLLLELADYNKGVLFVKFGGNNEDKVAMMRTQFMAGGTMKDRDVIITCQKAIDLGIIKEHHKDGQIGFYVGTELIGRTVQDVIVYSKQNPESYEKYIRRLVDNRDDYHDGENASIREQRFIESGKANTSSDVDELRQKTLALLEEVVGVVGGNNVSTNKGTLKMIKDYTKMKSHYDGLLAIKAKYEAKAEKKHDAQMGSKLPVETEVK